MISDILLALIPFSDDELEDISSYFKKEYISKNEVLVEQGQVCNKLYFVEKGIGRSYYLKKNGKEITQWFFGAGSVMSSADSFFQQSPSFYCLEILEDSIVYGITKSEMDVLLDKYHKMETLARLLSIEMLTKVTQKLNSVQFQTAKERYNYMLTEFPNISHRVPLGHIASYLGMTQETLSRIRNKESQNK